ncbi:MAG: 4-hydroxy-tetrahydrodipicolinate synthase [Gammaproteobacteria bacterium]|nr:MAG: 4-hydroxy-tetrahydrodipicolinate synthase [Gammaproteobacteria bacterium]
MITGSIVALVTPMTADGSIDWDALDRLIEWHIGQGTKAIVAVGTTGESATLSVPEHCQVIGHTVSRVAGRIAVIAGTGSNSTHEAIELSDAAAKVGADACLVVTPYYNRPTQRGLYEHHRAIAEAVAIDQILYNVPGRTAVDMSNDTAVELAEIPNIVGIKDATGDVPRGIELIQRCAGKMAVYSGDDPTALALMAGGAKGNVSVTANIAPGLMSQMCELALAGDIEAAKAIDTQLAPLNRALFVEANPIPVKWALYQMGKMDRGIRLPLTPLDERYRADLERLVAALGE